MLIDKGAAVARKLLPTSAFAVLRRLGTATLTPITFSRNTGHFRSSLLAAPVDAQGHPLPWYTYPMIHFLETKTFKECRVLEFGAGYSTLWWAERAAKVVSFESNGEWFRRLLPMVPPNVVLTHVSTEKPALEDLTRFGNEFDIIVIDGLHRAHCAAFTPDLLTPNGAIIIDNAEGYGMNPEESITGMFRDTFRRVDFYGHSPGVIKPHCTSLLWRDHTFLIDGHEPPRRFE
jgi:hypothetical protein